MCGNLGDSRNPYENAKNRPPLHGDYGFGTARNDRQSKYGLESLPPSCTGVLLYDRTPDFSPGTLFDRNPHTYLKIPNATMDSPPGLFFVGLWFKSPIEPWARLASKLFDMRDSQESWKTNSWNSWTGISKRYKTIKKQIRSPTNLQHNFKMKTRWWSGTSLFRDWRNLDFQRPYNSLAWLLVFWVPKN